MKQELSYQNIIDYREGIKCRCGNKKSIGAKTCKSCHVIKKNGSLSYSQKYNPKKKEYISRHSPIFKKEKSRT